MPTILATPMTNASGLNALSLAVLVAASPLTKTLALTTTSAFGTSPHYLANAESAPGLTSSPALVTLTVSGPTRTKLA